MGRISGDKARFHRQRRHHIARRAAMRELVKKLRGETPAAPQKTGGES
jgi:hypothetical protein